MSLFLEKYTLKDFQEMEYFAPTESFDSVVIVPLDEVHDSGFTCMKFILAKYDGIVGVVGGYSDIIHINGIGGYGIDYEKVSESRQVPPIPWVSPIPWKIDCLSTSHCLRLFCNKELTMDSYIGSDFSIYVKES